VIASQAARDDHLRTFGQTGVALAGLNVNGNPLHPNPIIGGKHAADFKRAIRAAGALGQNPVVMSGLPGGGAGSTVPNWVVNIWNSGALDVPEYQWNQVVVPFWKEIDRLAADNGVKVAIEMHPLNVVFTPSTLVRLVERTGATNIGAEMDPSHLFWQGMDPVAAGEYLGELVVHAAAKDVRINEAYVRIYRVLDERFRRLAPEETPVNLGGHEFLNEGPAGSAWDFVALGRGHDIDFWTRFIDALRAVDPDMAVNIEHEDIWLGRIESLQVAAEVLKKAAGTVNAPDDERCRY
jgi:sugar phosphate isomerase/epimerase